MPKATSVSQHTRRRRWLCLIDEWTIARADWAAQCKRVDPSLWVSALLPATSSQHLVPVLDSSQESGAERVTPSDGRLMETGHGTSS